MPQSKSRVTSTGTLRTVEDVRDFIIANDHLYDVMVYEEIKRRVGFYEAIAEANVSSDVVAEVLAEPEPETEPELENEAGDAPELELNGPAGGYQRNQRDPRGVE